MGSSPLATAGSASPSNSTTACLAKRFFRNRLDPLKPRILNDGALICCSWKMPPPPPPLSWKIPAAALAPARADPADIASPTNTSATAARIADCCPTRAHQRATSQGRVTQPVRRDAEREAVKSNLKQGPGQYCVSRRTRKKAALRHLSSSEAPQLIGKVRPAVLVGEAHPLACRPTTSPHGQ